MNFEFDEQILISISTFSILLPVAAGVWAYRRNNPLQVKLLFYLIFFTIIDFIVLWMSNLVINNMPLFHLCTMIEYLFIAYLYYKTIESTTYKKIILIGTILYLAYSSVWLYFIGDIFDLNHEPRIFESLLLALYALSYFNFLSKDLSTKPISFKVIPMFWISLGVLLYFTGNFFLFLFYRDIVTTFPELWTLHSVLNTITNCLFTISFLCNTKSI